jgi:alpha-beta hydrolase superfamily lysophospholipase
VVLAHGYYDHMGVWRHLLAALVAADWRVVCYDQPGHGLSGGEPAAIADFQTYVEVLDGIVGFAAERFPGDLQVVGHSMGAGVAADWLLQERGTAAGRVVLLAPLFHSSAWGLSRFGHTVAGQWFRAMPRKYRRNSGDADYLAFVRADPLQYGTLPASWVEALGRWNRQVAARPPSQRPLLVLQGGDDTTVDWGYNLPLLERLFPRADVRLVAGARHQLLNESPSLREAVVRQVLETLAAP